MVSFDDIAAAHERIRPQAHRTPVLSYATSDALTGATGTGNREPGRVTDQ